MKSQFQQGSRAGGASVRCSFPRRTLTPILSNRLLTKVSPGDGAGCHGRPGDLRSKAHPEAALTPRPSGTPPECGNTVCGGPVIGFFNSLLRGAWRRWELRAWGRTESWNRRLLFWRLGFLELPHVRHGSFELILQVAHSEHAPHPNHEPVQVERLHHEIIDSGIHRRGENLRESGR